MMAEVGFDKDAALVAAGALAEEANQRFGDNIDPNACIAGVKKFIQSDVDLKCLHCGWRKKGTKFCTQVLSDTGDAGMCNKFRHLFVVTQE